MRAVAKKDTSAEIKGIFALYLLLTLFCSACAVFFFAESVKQSMRLEISVPITVFTAVCAAVFAIWTVRYLPKARVYISYDGEALYLAKLRVLPSEIEDVDWKSLTNKYGDIRSYGKLTVCVAGKKIRFYCVDEIKTAYKRIVNIIEENRKSQGEKNG